jgi:hypothetical protein
VGEELGQVVPLSRRSRSRSRRRTRAEEEEETARGGDAFRSGRSRRRRRGEEEMMMPKPKRMNAMDEGGREGRVGGGKKKMRGECSDLFQSTIFIAMSCSFGLVCVCEFARMFKRRRGGGREGGGEGCQRDARM